MNIEYIIEGRIDRVIWSDKKTGAQIVNFTFNKKVNNYKSIRIKDYKGIIKSNQYYHLVGTFSKEGKFMNFNFTNATIILPDTKAKIVEYLASKHFPSIGKKTAKKVVKILDVYNIEEIIAKHKVIAKLIGRTQARIIHDVLTLNAKTSELNFILTQAGLSLKLTNIYHSFPVEETLKKILINPYFILEKNTYYLIWEMDQLANHLKISLLDKHRIIAHIIASFFKLANETGSTVIKFFELFKVFLLSMDYLELPREEIKKEIYKPTIAFLIIKGTFKKINHKITLTEIYESEKFILQRINDLKNIARAKFKFKNNFFDQQQNLAIQNAINFPLTIITGWPGTGKTTVLREIYSQLKNTYLNKDIEILTPTGKAATKINEANNLKAQTIHRFLKFERNGNLFLVNENNFSRVKVIIIDEFSMVDIELFKALLLALPNLDKLIIIGDNDQLPSITYGQLLEDFIDSKLFEITFLKTNHRQKKLQGLIKDIQSVNKKQIPSFKTNSSIFVEMPFYKVNDYIVKHFDNWFFGDDFLSTNILVPIYKHTIGINNINKLIQELRFGSKIPSLAIHNYKYYIGDKVINTKNDTQKDIFNGEIGFIKEIEKQNDKVKAILVEFEKGDVIYSPKEFSSDVSLAYALSVHKFQGSESKRIVLVLFPDFGRILSKKLIYTGMSRAIKKLIVLGNKRAFNVAFNSLRNKNRVTNMNLEYKKTN